MPRMATARGRMKVTDMSTERQKAVSRYKPFSKSNRWNSAKVIALRQQTPHLLFGKGAPRRTAETSSSYCTSASG